MTNKEILNIVMLEIVAPSDGRKNVEPKEVREEIYKRFKEHKPWKEVFEVIEDTEHRERYIELFEQLDYEGDIQ